MGIIFGVIAALLLIIIIVMLVRQRQSSEGLPIHFDNPAYSEDSIEMQGKASYGSKA